MLERSYPLIMASATKHENIISYILKQEADVNMKNEDGNTALVILSKVSNYWFRLHHFYFS